MRSLLLNIIICMLCIPPASAQRGKAWDKVLSKFDQGKIYAGIRLAEKQLSGKDPDRAFLVLRADGSNRIGKYARAETDAREAIEHVSGDLLSEAYLQLGIAMMETSRPDSARMWLERSIATSENSEAFLRLGRMELVDGENNRALQRFDRILDKEPDNVRALLERGAAHASLGDTAAARKDLDRAVELAPRNPVAWNSRGFHVHAELGRHERAIEDYDRAIKLDPNYSFAFNNRGWSYYKLGEVKKARKNISLAARKRATNPFVYRNLGVIALETGDTTLACIHFKKALTLDFDHAYGPEVSELVRVHCDGEVPAGTDTDPSRPIPLNEKAPVRRDPVRSNAP